MDNALKRLILPLVLVAAVLVASGSGKAQSTQGSKTDTKAEKKSGEAGSHQSGKDCCEKKGDTARKEGSAGKDRCAMDKGCDHDKSGSHTSGKDCCEKKGDANNEECSHDKDHCAMDKNGVHGTMDSKEMKEMHEKMSSKEMKEMHEKMMKEKKETDDDENE